MKKIVLMMSLMLGGLAFASVDVRDRAGVIPLDQQNALRNEGSRWPFDLHVLTGAFPNPAALESAVHRCVNGPNVVCIGIDPVHHKTVVHFGTATGISPSTSIPAAGNSYFKTGNWQGGIEAIASAARNAVGTATRAPTVYVNNTPVPVVPYGTQPVTVHVDSPSGTTTGMSTGWWLFLIFMGIGAGVVIYYVSRAVKTAKKVNEDMNDFRDEAFEMSSRNIEQADFHEKLAAKMNADKPKPMVPTQTKAVTPTTKTVAQTVTPTAPVAAPTTTVVHNHYGSNTGSGTLTGSVAGDILLANELTRPITPVVVTQPTVVHETTVVHDAPSSDNGGSSSSWDTKSDDNDSGGSSSSWDSGSSDSDSGSSSSWDSGSSDSGSSWDSGGGFDSGGGSDGGGGGSDW